jgi:nucleoid-associated protein YgaU
MSTNRTHKVAAGDTLWVLAGTYLQNYNRWAEIADLNRALLPDLSSLPVGVTLRIPER